MDFNLSIFIDEASRVSPKGKKNVHLNLILDVLATSCMPYFSF